MRVVWSESDRQFQEILNSEGISGKSVSDWRENCKCGGKLWTHFSFIRISSLLLLYINEDDCILFLDTVYSDKIYDLHDFYVNNVM